MQCIMCVVTGKTRIKMMLIYICKVLDDEITKSIYKTYDLNAKTKMWMLEHWRRRRRRYGIKAYECSNRNMEKMNNLWFWLGGGKAYRNQTKEIFSWQKYWKSHQTRNEKPIIIHFTRILWLHTIFNKNIIFHNIFYAYSL